MSHSPLVATLVAPTCESWLEYVPLPPHCLCPILFALFPNPSHHRLPVAGLDYSHSHLQLFLQSSVMANCSPTVLFSRFRIKLPLLISPQFFSFVPHVQKNKGTSVDAPEKHYVWHFQIIKCEITAYTEDLQGGMCQTVPSKLEPFLGFSMLNTTLF